MLVPEFIEWLKTQDQTAVVKVLQHTSGSGYYDQGGWTSEVDFDPLSGKVHTHTGYDGKRTQTLFPDCFEYTEGRESIHGYYPAELVLGCMNT